MEVGFIVTRRKAGKSLRGEREKKTHTRSCWVQDKQMEAKELRRVLGIYSHGVLWAGRDLLRSSISNQSQYHPLRDTTGWSPLGH